MTGFEPLTLSWKGEEYEVPANKVFPLVGAVEQAIMGTGTKPAVVKLLDGTATNYSLACGFGAALRAAGCPVTDEQVYLNIQQDFAEGKQDAALKLAQSNLALLSILSPPFAKEISEAQKKT